MLTKVGWGRTTTFVLALVLAGGGFAIVAPETPFDEAMAYQVAKTPEPTPEVVAAALGTTLRFEENRGQFGDDILFLASARDHQVAVATDGLRLSAGGQTVSLLFPGADMTGAEGRDAMGSYSNYFRGDAEEFIREAAHYAEVYVPAFLDGFDLRLYTADTGRAEFDVIARPGADPTSFRFIVEGGVPSLSGDEIKVATADGEFTLHAPVLFQETQAGRASVDGSYDVRDATVSFVPGVYDPSLPLIMDPQIGYATYYGGSSREYISGIAASPEDPDIIYITGRTQTTSSTMPIKDAYDDSLNDADDCCYYDAFVAKMDMSATPATNQLVWSTYLGGDYNDYGHDIVVHFDEDTNDGRVHVVGQTLYTSSMTQPFPIVNGAQIAYNNNGNGATWSDAFLSTFSLDGDLLYSTVWGGGYQDMGYAVATDDNGYAYMAGQVYYSWAYSNGAPMTTTTNAYQAEHGNQFTSAGAPSTATAYDSFLAKFDTTVAGPQSLLYATHLGAGSHEYAYGVAVDDDENAYVGGYLRSYQAPLWQMPPGAFDDTYNGYEGFIVKVPTVGEAPDELPWGTFFGGTSTDYGQAIAYHDNKAYLIGYGYSSSLPKDDLGFEDSYSGTPEGFVAAFDTTAFDDDQLIASTYIGGNSFDYFKSVHAGPEGVTVAGMTYNTGYPEEKQSSTIPKGSGYEIGVTRFTHDLSEAIYSVRMGGSGTHGYYVYNHHIVDVTSDGHAVIGSNEYYSAANLVQTSNPLYTAYDTSPGGCCQYDGLIVKLIPAPPEAGCVAPGTVFRGVPAIFTAADTEEMDNEIATYEWWVTTPAGPVNFPAAADQDSITYTFDPLDPPGTYDVTLEVTDTKGMSSSMTCEFDVENAPPSAQFSVNPNPPFVDFAVTFDGAPSEDPDWDGVLPDKGIATYAWSMVPSTATCGSDIVKQYVCTFTNTGIYEVTLEVTDADAEPHSITKEIEVKEVPFPVADFTHTGPVFSCGQPGTIKFTDDSLPADYPINKYEWDFESDGIVDSTLPVLTWSFPGPGSYEVTLKVTDTNGGSTTMSQFVDVLWATPPKASYGEMYGENPYLLGQTMLFSSLSQAGSMPITGYHWALGDGTEIEGTPDVEKQYTSGGTFPVTLTVSDDAGCSDSTSHSFTLNAFTDATAPAANEVAGEQIGPQAMFTASTLETITGEVVVFYDESLAGLAPIASWEWDFGDGAGMETTSAFHRFGSPGEYLVTLRIADAHGHSDIHSVTVRVLDQDDPKRFFPEGTPRPTADAGVDLVVEEGSLVQLDGTGSSGPTAAPLSYAWRQIQGPAVALSGLATPEPTFRAPALTGGATQESVVLELVVNDGNRASAPDRVVVRVREAQGPMFDAQLSPLGLLSVEMVEDVRDVSWDFGDGTVAYGPSAAHAYAVSGTYTVTATVGGESRAETFQVDVPTGADARARPAAATEQADDFNGFPFEGVFTAFLVVAAVSGAVLFFVARRR